MRNLLKVIVAVLFLASVLVVSASFAEEDILVTINCWGEEYTLKYLGVYDTDEGGGGVLLQGDKVLLNDGSPQAPFSVSIDYYGEKNFAPYKLVIGTPENMVNYLFYFRTSSVFFPSRVDAVWIYPEGDEKKAVLVWPAKEVDHLDEQFEVITFGHYEQDADPDNGPEPIEWLVLEKDDESALLLSRNVLDSVLYHERYEEVTWETCTLREWLNTEFVNTAFTEEDQARLVLTTVTADPGRTKKTDQGNDTQDRVFLLSYEEVKRLLPEENMRKGFLTPYAMERGKKEALNGLTSWTLRSSGHTNRAGTVVLADCSVNDNSYVNDCKGVRPVIRLRLEALGN